MNKFMKHQYTISKTKNMVKTPDDVHGVCHVKDLNVEFINSLYGSMNFTKDYDSLPLLVRMWLTTWRWKELLQLAESFGIENTDKILYSDFVEWDDESILTAPLIITNGIIAICSAPVVIDYTDFEATQETFMLPTVTNCSERVGEK